MQCTYRSHWGQLNDIKFQDIFYNFVLRLHDERVSYLDSPETERVARKTTINRAAVVAMSGSNPLTQTETESEASDTPRSWTEVIPAARSSYATVPLV